MKKKYFALALFLMSACFPINSFAQEWNSSFKLSYFSPKSSAIREEYGEAFAEYELEIGREIISNWQICSNIAYFGSFFSPKKSKQLDVIPLSLGLKYFWFINQTLDLTVSLCGTYTYAHFSKDHEPSKNKWGGGANFQAGLRYFFSCRTFCEFFIGYFYQHFNRHHSHSYSDSVNDPLIVNNLKPKHREAINIGGTKIGLAIGYAF